MVSALDDAGGDLGLAADEQGLDAGELGDQFIFGEAGFDDNLMLG
jgi:hypothetical protein